MTLSDRRGWLPRHDPSPVRAAERGANNGEHHGHDQADRKEGVRDHPLAGKPAADAFGLAVKVGEQPESGYEHRRHHHAAPERRITDQLLQTEKIPRGFGRVRGMNRIGDFLQRRVPENREEQHDRRHEQEQQELAENQVRPREHLVFRVLADLRRRAARQFNEAVGFIRR